MLVGDFFWFLSPVKTKGHYSDQNSMIFTPCLGHIPDNLHKQISSEYQTHTPITKIGSQVLERSSFTLFWSPVYTIIIRWNAKGQHICSYHKKSSFDEVIQLSKPPLLLKTFSLPLPRVYMWYNSREFVSNELKIWINESSTDLLYLF